MQRERKLLLGLIVVLIIVAIGAIVLGFSISTQPTLPANPSTPTNTPTSNPTTPVTPTSGDVTSGVVTNICGGPSNPSGIGNANGSGCGGDGTADCNNTGSASSGCTPDSNEYIYVVACDGQTGIECASAQGGRTVGDNIKGAVSFSSYLSQGCTIQIDVFADGVRPGGSASPVDFIVFQRSDCGGTTPVEAKCGEACTANSECVDTDNRCADDNVCVLKTCKDDPELCKANRCELKAPKACGGNCTVDANCETGNTCNAAGKCVLAACATNPSACNSDLCTLDTTQPQCGDACTSGSDCPTDHTCGSAGKCVLTSCLNGANCDSTQCAVVAVDVKQCGDSCTTSAECPNNHSCSNGQCVLNSCLPNKCTDGCTLPSTALISDSVDRLILGILAMLIGILAWKTNFHVQLFYNFGGRRITANFSEEERAQLEEHQKRQKELNKRRHNSNRRKSAKTFEDSLLDD